MDNQEQHYISPAQLRVGIYVHLDLSWMRHPFALSSFKIKDEAQIRTIQAMDLSQIRYDPSRSDCEPLLPDSSEPLVSSEEAHRVNFVPSSLSESNAVMHKQRLAEINRAIAECEKEFLRATSTARQVLANIATNPQAAAAEAEVLVAGMVDSILTEGDVILHSMDGSRLGDATYCHPLNVTVLALIVAKSLDMSVEDARLLGLAALFHEANSGMKCNFE